MSEHIQDIVDPQGNIVARVVYNPNQCPSEVPYWIELADGFEVYQGKQRCHDRSEERRLPVGVK